MCIFLERQGGNVGVTKAQLSISTVHVIERIVNVFALFEGNYLPTRECKK